MAKQSISKRAQTGVGASDGKWYPLPQGWQVFAGPPPTWLPVTASDKRYGIEQHCDGYYVTQLADGAPIRVTIQDNGGMDVGPKIGPFVDFWRAYEMIQKQSA